MIKGMIFDLDGTLSYTLDSIARSANEALESIGYASLPVENYRYYCGDGARELVRRVLIASNDTECKHFDELIEKYSELFSKYSDYKVRPYDGMKETIEEIKKAGLKLAVLSNKPHAQCIEVVEKLYGKGCFDVIQGYVDNIKRKPSPEGALIVKEKLGLNADEILYIGDTATDMQTGQGAKLKTVGVLWGYRDEAELKGANADYIIKEPKEILALIK